jgi:hypothetical protein
MPAGLVARIGLALLGAFLFASAVEILLHEAGHAAAGWVLGADFIRADVHPFRRSEVAVSYQGGMMARSSLLFSSAGILLAVAVSLGASLAAHSRSPFFLPVNCLGPTVLFVEGGYLIEGTLNHYGDPSAIATLAYLPQGLLPFVGGLMVVTAVLLSLRLIARAGVAEAAPWWARGAAFLAIACVALTNGLYALEPHDSSTMAIKVLAVGFAALAVVSICAGLLVHGLRKQLSWFIRGSGAPVSWPQAMVSLVAGLSVVGVLLALGN